MARQKKFEYEGHYVDRTSKYRIKQTVLSIVYHLFTFVLAIIMLYPIIWMVFSAFKPSTTIFKTAAQLILPGQMTVENFVNGWRGFAGTSFSVFFKNSFIISFVSTVGAVVSSAIVAYGFARMNFKGKGFWFACMLVSMMLPFQIIMIPQYLLFNAFGWVGTYLPMIVPQFFGQGFLIFLNVQFIRGIPYDLDEAALMDGCSVYGIFPRIIVPLIVPSLVTSAIFSFMWRWDDFMSALIFLNKPITYPVAYALKLFADPSSSSDYGAMFAMSTLSLVPIFTIFLTMQRYLVEGIASTGIKG